MRHELAILRPARLSDIEDPTYSFPISHPYPSCPTFGHLCCLHFGPLVRPPHRKVRHGNVVLFLGAVSGMLGVYVFEDLPRGSLYRLLHERTVKLASARHCTQMAGMSRTHVSNGTRVAAFKCARMQRSAFSVTLFTC